MAKVVTGPMRGVEGKVGGLVYAKGEKGQTIVREFTKPANPKTGAQVAQRIIWATVTQAAKYMKPIIDHSFEQVPYGKRSVREFVKRNVELLRSYAAQDYATQAAAGDSKCFVTTKNVSQLVPNGYLISEGSLSLPKAEVVENGGQLQLNIGSISGLPLHEVTIESDTFLGCTYGEMVKALFGLNALNEQITLVAIARNSDSNIYDYNDDNALGCVIAYTAMNARRLVFDPTLDLTTVMPLFNSDGTDAEDQSEVIANFAETIFRNAESDPTLISMVSYIMQQATLTYTAGVGEADPTMSFVTTGVDMDEYYIYDTDNDKGRVFAAGLVRSKFVDNKWRRSRCFLTMTEPAASEKNFGLYWLIANDAWTRKVVLTEGSRFLNEGGSENEVGENF